MVPKDYLFDVKPFTQRRVRPIPYERTRHLRVRPDVWQALKRVKVALDVAKREKSRRR